MISNNTAQRKARAKSTAGFTLVELLVVTAIFVVITGMILANHNRFGGRVILQNLAYDIALSIRQAQVYGISVRQFGGTFSGYGMHFVLSGPGVNPTTYVLFADIYPSVPNGLYDADQGEQVESNTIAGGYRIVDLCALRLDVHRSTPEDCDSITSLDVLFRRPEPDAYISANGVSGVANPGALQERGRIVLESPRADRMSVIVEIAGQIATQAI